MTGTLAHPEIRDPQGGFKVRRPRASDAIGKTLRGVFGNDDIVSSEFLALLRHIDRGTGTI